MEEPVISNKKLFTTVFNNISINDKYMNYLENVQIQNMDFYKSVNALFIYIDSENRIPMEIIEHIESKVKEKLKLDYVELIQKYHDSKMGFAEFIDMYKERIIKLLNNKVAVTKTMLIGSEWKASEGRLTIHLKAAGADFLVSKGCNRIIEKYIARNFGDSIKVVFSEGENELDGIDENYAKYKEETEKEFVAEAMSQVKREEPKKSDAAVKPPAESLRSSGVILGKMFKDELIRIVDITEELQKAAIQGKILTIDSREVRNGKNLVSFDIYDKTSSITVKMFLTKEKFGEVYTQLSVGKWVRIRGNVQYDKFSREITIMVTDIIEMAGEEVRKDNAETKRVELHLHTQMSALDAVTSAEQLIKRAAYWGHKAIAITDHGVVQAYPEAYTAGKKNNIKIIYGIECYLVDDKIPIIKNAVKHPLDGEFVVVDIETTGLSHTHDAITELGAVKIRNGEIVDKFSSLINPGVEIPPNIIKLTGITNEMVKDAPDIQSVLPDFVAFVGELPIIAHNAVFDLSFIEQALKKQKVKLKNPVIDTLILSRILLPELDRHKLSSVAEHLNVKVENCHRAVDDAILAGKVWIELAKILMEKNIQSIDMIDHELNGDVNVKKSDSYHAIILVKNQIGLRNLYKIVSESHLNYYYKKPRVPKSLYTKYSQGLMMGSACEAGELFRAILNKKTNKEIEKIAKFYDYLEIQPLGNNEFLTREGKVSREELIDINKQIISLGEKLNKPVVATCDVHFMDQWDEVYRRILMAGQGYSDADNQAPLYFRTTDEMLKEFNYLGPEKAYEVVVTNTNMIADMIEGGIEPIPQKTFPPKIEGAEQEIESSSMNKAREIYGDPLPEIVKLRLEKELNSIIKNGFSVMYAIAQKLVLKSNSDGYLVGSRGSVGSSFVATMSGITEVNALPAHYVCKNCKYSEFPETDHDCGVDMEDKNCPNCGTLLHKDGYDIPFETFLGFDGDKEPDIDLNFSGDYQPRAHKYVEELFGEGHVFRAGTIATVAEKTAYGFVKNYLADRNIRAFNAEINRLVSGCTGIKRTTGQHPGGVMIVPQDNDIYEFCPVQRPADDEGSDVITTHFDYHSIHGTLLKLDILGHDDPTVIRMLEDLTGVNARTIPMDDKETMKIFSGTESLGITPESINSEVGTFGIPEFGTKFVRQMLIDTKPTTFSELLKISGLSHGTDVWLNNAQDLIRDKVAKLSEVICCRDDIMLGLIKMGMEPKMSFKIMEDVRKGKGLKPEYEEAMKAKNVPEWYINSCNKIKYMFPKAHAVAYVMMAFRIAYFKVHYPLAFYTTYFTVRADDFDAEMMTKGADTVKRYIKELEDKGNTISVKEKNILTILEVANEMYQRGLRFLPIDLYKSHPTKFLIEDGAIRPPLNSLQGLGTVAAQNIAEARNADKFISKDELRVKAKVSKTVIEILDHCGCLEGLPESSQMSLF